MPVRNFPNLCERLGASKVDQICFQAVVGYAPSSNRVRTIVNPHRQYLMWDQFGDKPHVDDILSGIAQLAEGTEKGLSCVRLHAILKTSERISSELICDVMGLQERQARRYMAAAKLAIFHLSKHMVPRELVRRSPTLAELRQIRHPHYHPDEETNEPYEDPCRLGQPPPSLAS